MGGATQRVFVEIWTNYDHTLEWHALWSDAGPAGWVGCWLVNCHEPKTGQQKGQLYITKTINFAHLVILFIMTAEGDKDQVFISRSWKNLKKKLQMFLMNIEI